MFTSDNEIWSEDFVAAEGEHDCDDEKDNKETDKTPAKCDNEESLENQLWKQAITNKISLSAQTELLKILKPYVVEHIPTDGRSLLKTPAASRLNV